MMLVVGGAGSGKRDYVKRRLGCADEDIAPAVLDDKPVFADLHRYVREKGARDADLVPALLRKKAVICNEVGCGVVPMDAAERAWRDDVGRLCAVLAARADTVVRLCCGIPQVF